MTPTSWAPCRAQRSFEQRGDDIGAAIDALLQHQPEVRQEVLWGLFEGASAALRKLRAARGTTETKAAGPDRPPFQVRMAHAWQQFQGPLQLLRALSGRNYTAREFTEAVAAHPAWQGALVLPGVTRHEAPAADHTFSNRAEQETLERVTSNWLRRTCPSA